MKRIVIVTREMVMGGIERALISMLKSIPEDSYDVTVLVMGTGGELLDEIPDHVKVECLYGYENTTVEKIWNQVKKGRWLSAFKIGWYTFLYKKTKDRFKQDWYHSKMIPIVDKEYDLAVAYHVPASFPVIFVLNNIKAKSKVAWIHSDVSQYVEALKPYIGLYKGYDKIFCVSKYAMNNFNKLYPYLKEKTSVFYNLLDQNEMTKMAEEDKGFDDQFGGIRILTVGRLSKEKGQDIIPGILRRLKSEGINIRWYCIGDGATRLDLEKMIVEYGLEKQLILLGTKKNPYSYIKQCDIYIQPSRHEGYCISLAEARKFNRPIITTDFVGAREQIMNGENGMIIDFDEIEMYEAIKTLVSNPSLCSKFEKNLKRININSTNELKKLLDCVV